ncbi:LytR/AlgR family response regulator transcription factor [Spirosoma pollinicola]|uniref:DNA-binding response regulator n=1 Tax=Spirosoma pollinicola TaxID=2057025 RepID=A0A2K8YUK2_9BACT|nr:LytTR family DNA-binding domain-containing protein [Spirosoma pollinicola]AUD01306.1 hypothetical protein CWM47_05465 [Spirosoma pollinicola]
MSPIRIILLEDNPIDSLTIQIMLTELVDKEHQLDLVAVFETLTPLLVFLETNEVDIVIADIFMNNKPVGLSLFDYLKHRPISLLFVSNTNDKDIFLEAQRKSSFRFISKPINLFTLHANLYSIYEEMQRNRQYNLLAKQYLYLSGKGGQQEQVLFDDIVYIESEGNYCFVFTTAKKYALKKSLSKVLEEDLDVSFLRIHRAYIVNKSAIKQIGPLSIKVNEHVSLPIGRHYRKSLMEFARK